MLHETLLIIQCFCDERLKVQSHLPLFCKFSRANSSHFNRNLHHWEFHVRAKEVLTQITVLILRKDSFSFCSHVPSSWYKFIYKRDIRIIYIQNKQIINKKKMRDVTSVLMLRRTDSHRFGQYKLKLAPYLQMSEILQTIWFNVTIICLIYKAQFSHQQYGSIPLTSCKKHI